VEHPVTDVQSRERLGYPLLQTPMIIEFIGVQGAGKSTMALVARQVLRDLGLKAMFVPEASRCCLMRAPLGRVIRFVTPPRWQERVTWGVFRRLLVLYKVQFAVRNRTLALRVLGVLARRQLSWRDKRSIMRWFFRDASYYRYFSDRLLPDEVLILDEGLVHRATSLYTSASEDPSLPEVTSYVKLLPRSDLVIWVQASLDICAARVSSRGMSKRYLGRDLAPYLNNSAKTIDIALQGIRDIGWDTVVTSNDGNLEACAGDLRGLLKERVIRRNSGQIALASMVEVV
jgi:thymidylate kinase